MQAPHSIYAIEDITNDIEALARLMLHCSEATTPEEFGGMSSVINTTLYLTLEKVSQLRPHITAIHMKEARA